MCSPCVHHTRNGAEQYVYRMGAWAQSGQAGRFMKQVTKTGAKKVQQGSVISPLPLLEGEGKCRQTFVGVQPTSAPRDHPSSGAQQLVNRMGAWAQSAQAARFVI